MEDAEVNAFLVEDCTRGKNGNSILATITVPVHRVGLAGGASGHERAASGGGRATVSRRRVGGRDSVRPDRGGGPSSRRGADSEKCRQ